ncbi:MAG: hypothetical protein FWF20_03800 [Betaproteobacteria bacterium]|nr:hypothetical protein [Betaproteobacteria bacterium]MCL2885907.1 hypothetical protein [Betaproteobacteria bacterium]
MKQLPGEIAALRRQAVPYGHSQPATSSRGGGIGTVHGCLEMLATNRSAFYGNGNESASTCKPKRNGRPIPGISDVLSNTVSKIDININLNNIF